MQIENLFLLTKFLIKNNISWLVKVEFCIDVEIMYVWLKQISIFLS